MTNENNSRLTRAISRAVLAVLAAAAILTLTNFSVLQLIAGPKKAEDGAYLEAGDYVSLDIPLILGFYAQGSDSSGEVTSVYAAVPYNDVILSVRLPERYIESSRAILDNSEKYMLGLSSELTQYITVEGSVSALGADATTCMNTWFSDNETWLVGLGYASGSGDYADSMLDIIIKADSVGGMSEWLVIALSAAAALLIIYAGYEIVRCLSGKYKDIPAEPENGNSPDEAAEEADSDEI